MGWWGNAGRVVGGAAVAAVLVGTTAAGARAQDTIEIRDDGGYVSDSAAGPDNVTIERNPGSQRALAAEGTGNQEIRRAPRQNRERDRDRGGRGGGGNAAPAEGGVADAGAAPVETAPAPAVIAPAEGAAPQPVQLPSTGAGGLPIELAVALAAAAAGLGAAGAGAAARRGRIRP